jgi:cystathionine beta-lyase family protein involved in aluminum resistance
MESRFKVTPYPILDLRGVSWDLFQIYSFICLLSLLIYSNCSAQAVSSNELINRAKEYDEETVVFSGEAIGEVMQRGDFAWINIHDGRSAIGCWMEYALAKQIVYTGSYKAKGDWVEASGIFRRACPEHGGDLDIHVQTLRIIYNGRRRIERLNLEKRNTALILLGVLCLALILRLFRKR